MGYQCRIVYANEGLVHQVRKSDRMLACDKMLCARYDDKLVMGQKASLQCRQIGYVRGNSKIGSTFRHRQNDLDTWALVKIHRQVGMRHQETTELMREGCDHRSGVA